MFYSPKELESRARRYCHDHNLKLAQALGNGTQGIVFSTNRESALKVHAREEAYSRERDVYLRLRDRKVHEMGDFIIPRLYSSDDELLIIEMSLVSAPFIVDFGGAYLDELPEHFLDPSVREYWQSEKKEQFGDQWEIVQAVIADFSIRHGIHIVDVNTGNIQF